MKELYPWAKPLNISSQKIEEWSQNLTPGKSILAWALENFQVTEWEYINWAQRHYELPILKDDFLQERSNIKSKYHSDFWSQELQPIYEWQNILYVACLHPPFSQKLRDTLQKSVNKHIVYVLSPYTSLVKLWGKTESNDFITAPVENTNKGFVEETAQATKNTKKVDHLDFSQLFSEKPATTPPPPVVAPQVPPVVVAPPPVIAPQAPQSRPVASTIQNAATAQSSIITKYASELGVYFQKFMIITHHANYAEPIEWSPGWKLDSIRSKKIDLSTPSIFQIVAKSKSHYHGYAAPNPVNDAFFSTFNDGSYPEHVTIVPILEGHNLIGYLLGTCSKESAKNFSLEQLDRVASRLADELPTHSKAGNLHKAS